MVNYGNIILKGESEMGIKRKIDNLGRIVLCSEHRKELGIECGDEIEMTLENNSIVFRKADSIDIREYIKSKQLEENVSTETYRVLEDILEKMK
jgi:bifunctional DNA-binding transcriptional regulator/antitoxin component of YhaV-PrlF toxin-antitoxin module